MKRIQVVTPLILLSLIALTGCACGPAALPVATDTPVPTEPKPTNPPPTATPVPTEEEKLGTWEIVHQIEAESDMTVAGFADDTFGVATGHYGHVGRAYHTVDGGQTWTKIASAPKPFGVDVVDDTTAWAAGEGGRVWVTTDGAQTWQAVSNTSYPGTMPFVSFLDDTTGWVASPEQLEATTDGGQTWTQVALPEDVGIIAAISLRAASDGYLLDNKGTLYTTQDGGQSWSSQALGLDAEILTVPAIPFTALRFTDADRGVIALSLVGGKGALVIMHTTDGGQTWQEASAPVNTNALHLSHDGAILTVTSPSKEIVVLRYQE